MVAVFDGCTHYKFLNLTHHIVEVAFFQYKPLLKCYCVLFFASYLTIGRYHFLFVFTEEGKLPVL